MAEEVDITGPVRDICAALGLDPGRVGRLDMSPYEVEATVYKVDADGHKYFEDDEPAVETVKFAVRTY